MVTTLGFLMKPHLSPKKCTGSLAFYYTNGKFPARPLKIHRAIMTHEIQAH